MLKKYRKTLIITTLVMLIPVLVGLLLWNRLPEQVPTHFNAAGEADGFSSRAFAVFGLPAVLLGLHWLCALGSLKADPKAENLDTRMMNLVLWICPAVSLVMLVVVYGTALGVEAPVALIIPLLVGLMMVIIGNWLPKCKQTYTMGIKLPWTLADEDNWNRTHRFAGPIWVIGGFVAMVSAFLGEVGMWLMLAALAVMVLAPSVYSYLLFSRKRGG